MAPKERAIYTLDSHSSKEVISSRPGTSKSAAPVVSQVLYQAVPREKWEDKCPSLHERQQCKYCFSVKADWVLFDELVENNLLTLPEPRCHEEVARLTIQILAIPSAHQPSTEVYAVLMIRYMICSIISTYPYPMTLSKSKWIRSW